VETSIPAELVERVAQLAAETALPEMGDAVATGIDLAVQLLTQGVDHPAVVKVAALEPGATRSDAEPPIREMLIELGMEIPDGSNEASRYELLRHGVGFWNLPIAMFEGTFYLRIPSWDQQGTPDRAIVQLLDQRDHVTDPSARQPIDDRIRAAVRYAEDAAALARIGVVLADQGQRQPARLPRDLIDTARRAWHRDEPGVLGDELPEERSLRHRAATLALIGLAVDERGAPDGDHVLVALDPDVVSDAISRGDIPLT
jgi:hypothetical protein